MSLVLWLLICLTCACVGFILGTAHHMRMAPLGYGPLALQANEQRLRADAAERKIALARRALAGNLSGGENG